MKFLNDWKQRHADEQAIEEAKRQADHAAYVALVFEAATAGDLNKTQAKKLEQLAEGLGLTPAQVESDVAVTRNAMQLQDEAEALADRRTKLEALRLERGEHDAETNGRAAYFESRARTLGGQLCGAAVDAHAAALRDWNGTRKYERLTLTDEVNTAAAALKRSEAAAEQIAAMFSRHPWLSGLQGNPVAATT